MVIFFEIPIILIIFVIVILIGGGVAAGAELFTFISDHFIGFLIASVIIGLIEGIIMGLNDDIDNKADFFTCSLTLPPVLLFPFLVGVPAVVKKFSGSDDFDSLFFVLLETPWLILFLIIIWFIIALFHGISIGISSIASIPVTVILGIVCCAIEVTIFVEAYNSYIGEFSKLFSQ